jgi:hypothetical protein
MRLIDIVFIYFARGIIIYEMHPSFNEKELRADLALIREVSHLF